MVKIKKMICFRKWLIQRFSTPFKFNTYLSCALNKAINFDAFHIVDIQL